MAKRSGFVHAVNQVQRDVERRRAAELRTQTQAARAAERAQREYQRAIAAEAKVRQQLYVESRVAEVDLMNESLSTDVAELERILEAILAIDDYFDLDRLKVSPTIIPFDPGALGVSESVPVRDSFLPEPLSGIARLVPGAKARYEQQLASAEAAYSSQYESYLDRERQRKAELQLLRDEYDSVVAGINERTTQEHSAVDQLKKQLAQGDPDAIVQYFSLVLESSVYPEQFPQHAKLAFVPESRQLVVEYDLPTADVVPDTASYRYVKAKDEITTTQRPATQKRNLYASVIAQVALRTIHELYESDRHQHVDSIVFNGYVDAIDASTGHPARPCLITVRTTRDVFESLDLSRVDPSACLRALNASVSKSPAELAPVRPVLEFNMVDSRFIEETDILSNLDQRPNLMELTPGEFESLISNLFQKMGLETRLTQASRDGGVDCVAYDPRPIFGGKVVIQAKRYKDTVGVSAVRDLYGTVQNEGASKGILVTTSGYGAAAFEFAEGKPLELLSGSHLLSLLAEHAGIEAKIVVPEE